MNHNEPAVCLSVYPFESDECMDYHYHYCYCHYYYYHYFY